MKQIILLSCFLLICSCNSNKNFVISYENNTWIIGNAVLKELIINYVDSVKTNNKKKFVCIDYRKVNDSTSIYSLHHCADINDLIYGSPPLLFLSVERILVYISIAGFEDFQLDKISLIKIMQLYFPDQYQYFIECGEFPPPITGGELVWEVTIQNGKVIKKKTYY
jgi:hypothetical protein